jgi:hypothetical protein
VQGDDVQIEAEARADGTGVEGVPTASGKGAAKIHSEVQDGKTSACKITTDRASVEVIAVVAWEARILYGKSGIQPELRMEREGRKGQERENEQSQRSHQAKTPVSNLLSRRRPGERKAGEKPQRHCGSAGSIPDKLGEEFGDEGLQA